MFFALTLVGCGSEEEPTVAPPPVAAPLSPMHGGTLVPLHDHRVELLAHASGELFGYLTRMDGQPLTSPEGALLTVTVTVDADHARPVLLRWNGDTGRYEARLRDAPVEGPADVSLMISGRPARGSTDRLPIDAALTESGVAYAESEESLDDEETDEAESAAEEGGGEGSGRGGRLRARARRLFGL